MTKQLVHQADENSNDAIIAAVKSQRINENNSGFDDTFEMSILSNVVHVLPDKEENFSVERFILHLYQMMGYRPIKYLLYIFLTPNVICL